LIHNIQRRFAAAAILFVLVAASTFASQARPQSVTDGVYTAEQATRGQTVYRERCSTCHGAALDGRSGPPLAGNDFVATWSARPVLDLASKIRLTMPKDDGPRLTPAQTSDLVAYILQAGKFPAGRSELSADEAALKQLTFPGQAAASPKTATFTALPPAGNVGQVMRGILFPSANIIFAVQGIDPGVKRTIPTDNTGQGFDWFTWGMGVYPGWEVVDYAAVSVAESATLMLTPGRRCENGRPVPVSDPDWIKFTNELAEAGKAAYKASQTRKQDAVSDSTNQLNDSCMNCHRVYRGRTHCVKP
jgi:mono/diheme cytochrome c family protein